MYENFQICVTLKISGENEIILDKLLIAKLNHASVRSNSRLFVLLDLIQSDCSHQTSVLTNLQKKSFFVAVPNF